MYQFLITHVSNTNDQNALFHFYFFCIARKAFYELHKIIDILHTRFALLFLPNARCQMHAKWYHVLVTSLVRATGTYSNTWAIDLSDMSRVFIIPTRQTMTVSIPPTDIHHNGEKYVHYNDVIMSAMVSPITSFTIVYSSVYSGADQRKHQSFALLAFMRGIHKWPVNSPHKGPVTRKMFPFDDVIMCRRKSSI